MYLYLTGLINSIEDLILSGVSQIQLSKLIFEEIEEIFDGIEIRAVGRSKENIKRLNDLFGLLGFVDGCVIHDYQCVSSIEQYGVMVLQLTHEESKTRARDTVFKYLVA